MEGSITQLGLSNYLIDKSKKGKSFFQHSYHNYKNFAEHSKTIPFDNSFNYLIDNTNKISLRLDNYGKYGDLITNMYVEITLPTLSTTGTGASTGWCNGVGNAIFKEITLRINNDEYSKITSEYMDIWGELSTSSKSVATYKQMVRKYSAHNYNSFKGGKVLVPLQFWFCRSLSESYNNDKSLVFPLKSLMTNDITLDFKLRSFQDLTISEDDTVPTLQNIVNANLVVDYIILEKEERKLFEPSIDYKFISKHIMTQVQLLDENISAGTLSKTILLRELKYPVTELIWVIRTNVAENANQYFNYGDSLNTINNNPINKIEFKIEGKYRMNELNAEHYSQVELTKRHTNNPNNFIHIYSFALEPENFAQPSGICNFSDIHEGQLILNFNSGLLESKLLLFAINYNVIEISEKGNVSLLHNLSGSTP